MRPDRPNGEKRMNPMKVRTLHRYLGISVACFLLIQALSGMLMAAARLALVEDSQALRPLSIVHAGLDPAGSIYRIALGLVVAAQVILGVAIFVGLRSRGAITAGPSATPADRPNERKEVAIMSTVGFAEAIRPLFRERDISAMKPMGIDLSSYEDVKKRASDIYGRLSAKEMPCDGGWSNDRLQKLKEWIDGGMAP